MLQRQKQKNFTERIMKLLFEVHYCLQHFDDGAFKLIATCDRLTVFPINCFGVCAIVASHVYIAIEYNNIAHVIYACQVFFLWGVLAARTTGEGFGTSPLKETQE